MIGKDQPVSACHRNFLVFQGADQRIKQSARTFVDEDQHIACCCGAISPAALGIFGPDHFAGFNDPVNFAGNFACQLVFRALRRLRIARRFRRDRFFFLLGHINRPKLDTAGLV